MSENQNNNKGAAWRKTGKNGEIFYSGQITINGQVIYLNIFKNKFKKEEKQPNLILSIAERKR